MTQRQMGSTMQKEDSRRCAGAHVHDIECQPSVAELRRSRNERAIQVRRSLRS